MGQTIGFPASAAKLNRSSRVAGKRRIDRKLLSHTSVNPTPPAPTVYSDVEVYFDPPEEYFGLTTPTTKDDYDVYMTGETLKAGVYPHNREFRFIERALADGKKETIYSGPNFLDSRTVIENADGEILCTIRANHLGNGLVEVRYLEGGCYITEHQAPEEHDNFSFQKDARGRITSLKLGDGTYLQFAYGGTSPVAYKFTDKDGVDWRRCPKTGVFKNETGEDLALTPVQMVAANESGSYMFASYGRYTVMHRNGDVEERYFPTVRDLLDQKLPVTVAIRAEKDLSRAEVFAKSLRAQYRDADLRVAVLPVDAKDGHVVEGRHVSRFY